MTTFSLRMGVRPGALERRDDGNRPAERRRGLACEQTRAGRFGVRRKGRVGSRVAEAHPPHPSPEGEEGSECARSDVFSYPMVVFDEVSVRCLTVRPAPPNWGGARESNPEETRNTFGEAEMRDTDDR